MCVCMFVALFFVCGFTLCARLYLERCYVVYVSTISEYMYVYKVLWGVSPSCISFYASITEGQYNYTYSLLLTNIAYLLREVTTCTVIKYYQPGKFIQQRTVYRNLFNNTTTTVYNYMIVRCMLYPTGLYRLLLM